MDAFVERAMGADVATVVIGGKIVVEDHQPRTIGTARAETDRAPRLLAAAWTGLADPSRPCANLCRRPSQASGTVHRRVPLQVAFGSLRPIALATQFLHAGADRGGIIGS